MYSTVVTHTAKVLKFKQITTTVDGAFRCRELLLILQRYSNLSKSQLTTSNLVVVIVVTHTAKVLKFKQITTQQIYRVAPISCYSYCKGTQI